MCFYFSRSWHSLIQSFNRISDYTRTFSKLKLLSWTLPRKWYRKTFQTLSFSGKKVDSKTHSSDCFLHNKSRKLKCLFSYPREMYNVKLFAVKVRLPREFTHSTQETTHQHNQSSHKNSIMKYSSDNKNQKISVTFERNGILKAMFIANQFMHVGW